MSADSEVRDVRVRSSWPPVEVVERAESREELSSLALLSVGLAMIAAGVPFIPMAFALPPAVGAVVATALWLAYPRVHSGGDA